MAFVMVVEDEPQVLVLAVSILKDAGHETLSATNYAGAFALLEEGHRPDLSFIDHNLGKGLTGLDLARTARQYRADMQVLYTSADHMSDGIKAMFVEGAEFLQKPYTPAQLVEAVNRLLNAAGSYPAL